MESVFVSIWKALRSAVQWMVQGLRKRRGVVRWLVYGIVFIVLAGAGFVVLVWAGVFGEVPGRSQLQSINNQVATEVYSADSVLLGRYYLQERSPVTPDQIPDGLRNALISTEDARFYSHHGIDILSLFRVFVKTLALQDASAGGGSTITQQLAKNLFPRRSYTFLSMPINKVKEMIVAHRIEQLYSKQEILALYLNTIPFGDNVFGIKTAAERFYSKPVQSLATDESAVLIGMLKATYRYNPRVYPDRAKQRRNVVLAQMEKYGHLTVKEADELQAKPLALKYQRLSHNEGLAPYFRSYIKAELLAWCRQNKKADGSPYNLYTDGLKIYTTIDSRLQQFAEEAVRSQMAIIQSRFNQQLSKTTLASVGKSHLSQLASYKEMKRDGLSEDQITAELKKKGTRRVFDWKGEKEQEISIYDSLLLHLKFLQAGLLAMDPHTGALRAWVGGINHEFFQYDHVRESTKRQVGSTFKPVVYAAAMEQGVSPCDYVSARQTSYTNMEDWTPQNSDAGTYDQKYSMEGGLAGSVNTVSVKLIEQAGIGNTIRMAERMGIRSELPRVPSLALGTASISVLEMVNAYSAFANQGKHVSPAYITAIADSHGVVLDHFVNRDEPVAAISKETSAMMLHMLRRVVNEGTGSSLRTRFGLSNDIAGKTGTTQSNTDGWFIAITPRLVIGCWVGADDPRIHFKSTALGQGAATALPVVGRFLQQMNADPSFSRLSNAKFESLTPAQMKKLDCELSKSDRNFLDKLFNRKKGVKETEYQEGKQDNAGSRAERTQAKEERQQAREVKQQAKKERRERRERRRRSRD
ncbi:transglycosylase domain-containing protein [Chryseolinea sp. T2]|uniref:penicillin-binding protein 1A n=1 Tax=Chryseolinea sp. T2 TaxID=3129255 RepID=UPI003076F1B6